MRRHVRISSVIVLSVVAAGWAALARPAHPAGPGLDGRLEVVLEEHERGQVAVARYEVTNPGGQELVLGGVRSSCSCAGLEVDGADGPKRVETLRIAPGGRAVLMVRMTVNGRAGEGQSAIVYATTNLLERPEVGFRLVVARITGGLELRPQGVAVGRVPVGGRAVRVVEIVDRSPVPRAVAKVTTVGDGFTARLLTPDGSAPEVIGRIEVEVDTSRPRVIDGRVLVWQTADQSATAVGLAVSGRVVSATPEG